MLNHLVDLRQRIFGAGVLMAIRDDYEDDFCGPLILSYRPQLLADANDAPADGVIECCISERNKRLVIQCGHFNNGLEIMDGLEFVVKLGERQKCHAWASLLI